jgi:hypothetical protein
MNKIYYIIPILFLFTIFIVNAYTSNDLIDYYDFNNPSNQIVGVNGNVMNLSEGFNTSYSDIGKVDNALNVINQSYIVDLGDYEIYENITINFWIKQNHTIPNYFLNLVNSTSTGQQILRNVDPYFVASFWRAGSQGTSSQAVKNIVSTNYNMITLIYSASGGIEYYLNGAYNKTISYSFVGYLFPDMRYIILGRNGYTNFSIDELSVWNIKLDSSEIQSLYNNGSGLNYTDTFYIAALEYTNEFIDICIPINILCHHLYYNNSNGAYCPILEQELCSIGCTDNSSYWYNISTSPIDMNYSGHCSVNYIGGVLCDNVGDTRCKDASTIETCLKNAFDYNTWITTHTCLTIAECRLGQCVNKNSVWTQEQLNNGEEPTDFINSIPIAWRYVIMIILTFAALLTVALIVSGQAGALAGLSISTMVSLSISILFSLSILIPIVYIIISAAIITIIIKTTVV